LTAKARKPHATGEELILPVAKANASGIAAQATVRITV
jgi:hypothetical protein